MTQRVTLPAAAPSASHDNSKPYRAGTNLAVMGAGIRPSNWINMARMKTFLLLTLATLAAPALAADGKAVLGGAIGGGTGAAVGSAMGGRDGAIIGGALGGAAGAAIATSGSKETKVTTKEVIVEKEAVYGPRPHRVGEYKEKFRDGPCKVEREQKRDGSYKEARECKGVRSGPYRHTRGDYEEKYWDGPCKIEREWKRDGTYKEKIDCKGDRD